MMPEHILPDFLSAYLDHELSDCLRRRVEQHLEVCRACRKEYEQLRHLRTLLRTAPAPSFPPAEHFSATLLHRLHGRSASTRAAFPPPVWAVPVVLLTLWLILRLVFLFGNLLGLAQGAGLLQGTGLPAVDHEANIWMVLFRFLADRSGIQLQPWLSLLPGLSNWYIHLRQGFMVHAGLALAYWLWILSLRLVDGRAAVRNPAPIP